MEESNTVRALQPSAPSAPLPAGTVTFLLADIEGSVRLWEKDRAAMTSAVTRLDGLLDREVKRNQGVRPVQQGEGDSFVVAFARATDAASCALALQRGIADEPWLAKLDLRVRMALHTGDAQLRDEGNYVGNAINRAGRLRSLAHGGQILVSPTTFELVTDGLPEGAGLRDLGLQQIRDLARPVRVYQLTHADLDDSFPPLRSLEVLTQHLPRPLTAFIGREPELRDVAERLTDARLLTLTGAGGCGKTRLAIQTVRATAEHYPDGVWFADLSLVRDPVEVPRTVAAAIGRNEQPHQDVTSTLVEYLRPRRALLVLDNCEHLLGACAELASTLLQGCPALTIIATSREPLRVEGEMAWRVPSMSTPSDGSYESLATYDAVRLFIERAVQARPNFTVTNDNAPAVAAICQHLDGIPLAIELAAARVRVLTPDQIARGLSDRFHFLGGGARKALPRQQTLAASVEWSHDLLADRERVLLRRLSVFAGGFTLDAAENVCAGDDIDVYDILDLLSSLVDKSLVVMEEDDGSARYRFLETIRQYAREQLETSGEMHATRERHAHWYAGFVAHAGGQLGGPDQVRWFARLDREHDNIRAALDCAVTVPMPDIGLQIIAAMGWFWNVHGHWHEAVRWIERAAAMGDGPPLLLEVAEFVGAGMRGMVGDGAAELPVLEAAAARYRRSGNHWFTAWSLNLIAKYTAMGDVARGLEFFEEGLVEARASGDTILLTDTLAYGAWIQLTAGRTASAEARAVEARRVATAAGDVRGQLVALLPRAAVAVRRADYTSAVAMLDEAMDLAASIGDRLSMAVALLVGGQLEMARGELDRARELLNEGVEVGRETGVPFLAAAGAFVAAASLAAGDPKAGLSIYDSETSDEFSFLFYLSPKPAGRSEALLALGDLASARTSVEKALQVVSAAGNTMGVADTLLTRGRVCVAEGQPALAEADAHGALAIFVEAEASAEALSALEVIACCAADNESYREAARLLGATQALRAEFGCVRRLIEQQTCEKTIDGLHNGLEPEDLEAAFAEGTAMSLEQAVAYAARGRGERKRPSTGWESLTPAELEVVRLVATGATNRDVAEQLFISTNTVKIHLSHVFAKLGVSSRSELTAAAVRRVL
jgi:predicted ATPase/class 3 adenylate cyclase/DNA-binding CsgD family transcriptional regulator